MTMTYGYKIMVS